MLKQSSVRNHQRSRRLINLKRSLQICVMLVIFMWFLYQFKRAHNNEDRNKQKSENGEVEYHHQLMKMGRKDLIEQGSDFGKRDDIIAELNLEEEEEEEEGRSVVEKQEANYDKEEEIESDDDKEANEENNQFQDLIDEDDKD